MSGLNWFIGDAGFDESEAEFRSVLREWLTENPPPSSGSVSSDRVRDVLAWHAELASAGLACPHWPVEYGGTGAPLGHQLVFLEELARVGLSLRPVMVGLYMVAPLLFELGGPDLIDRYVPDILYGRSHWCQLFSEPMAGSDLASLRTRAVPHEGGFVLHGQKVWSSYAHVADFGLLIARTDVDAPAHKGLSLFVVDMSAPGVEIRPLRQLTGGQEFNEVFLDGLEVPKDALVGTLNDGWSGVINVLSNERSGLALTAYAQLMFMFSVEAEAMRFGHANLRDAAAHVYTTIVIQRLTSLRAAGGTIYGSSAPVVPGVGKLQAMHGIKGLAELRMRRVGASGVASDHGLPFAASELLGGLTSSIAGGTSEIQKNVIGERVLGLPREPR